MLFDLKMFYMILAFKSCVRTREYVGLAKCVMKLHDPLAGGNEEESARWFLRLWETLLTRVFGLGFTSGLTQIMRRESANCNTQVAQAK